VLYSLFFFCFFLVCQRSGTTQGELLGSTTAIGHVNSKMLRKCPIEYGLGPLSSACKAMNQPHMQAEEGEM
jgi:hypothetical protein